VLTDDLHWQTAAGRHNIRMASNINRDAVFNDLFSRFAAMKA
jgi:hypothetical protein